MRRLGRSSTGFTLLEILIVLALAGVIVSLVAPNFQRVIPEMRVIRAAQKLATDIKLAQQKSVAEMAIVNFHVDVGQNRYFAEVRDRNATGLWYQDGYDEYLEDPLNSGAYLLVDFDEQSSGSDHGAKGWHGSRGGFARKASARGGYLLRSRG